MNRHTEESHQRRKVSYLITAAFHCLQFSRALASHVERDIHRHSFATKDKLDSHPPEDTSWRFLFQEVFNCFLLFLIADMPVPADVDGKEVTRASDASNQGAYSYFACVAYSYIDCSSSGSCSDLNFFSVSIATTSLVCGVIFESLSIPYFS
ncbi:hypothetical protein Naga_100801g2 [Nannochloropsis gaditana]|uniref:Uncharacterized protein n=1 Tax=Nannochloropsis gaditana TaxID=72520 RepID=W7TNW0_9STRA|nr:hypothetical protein Naga_100801g2 [Nannochloropsis gaditana]